MKCSSQTLFRVGCFFIEEILLTRKEKVDNIRLLPRKE